MILRQLGLVNAIRENKICFDNEGDIFWTNTLPLGFSTNRKGKDEMEIIEYGNYIDGLNESNNKEELFKNYLEEGRLRFRNLLTYNPRFIFVFGNSINHDRFFSLIKEDPYTKPIATIDINFRLPKSTISQAKFYQLNGLKFVICTFFDSRWTDRETDVQRLVTMYNELFNINQ